MSPRNSPAGRPRCPPFLETLAAALIAAAGLAACGGGRAPASLSEIRVGYFPNITHSQALIG
ncbi:MAG: hypothetical protein MUO23_04945, partial [Anaerolineales bacterium]|nr:hypothetical protein [Anaerolineales bacterium]